MVSVTPIPGCRSEFAAVLRCRLCPHRLLPRSAWIRFITCRKAVAQSNTIAPQAPNAQDPHSTSVRTGDSSGSSDRTAAGPSAMLIGRLVDRLSAHRRFPAWPVSSLHDGKFTICASRPSILILIKRFCQIHTVLTRKIEASGGLRVYRSLPFHRPARQTRGSRAGAGLLGLAKFIVRLAMWARAEA